MPNLAIKAKTVTSQARLSGTKAIDKRVTPAKAIFIEYGHLRPNFSSINSHATYDKPSAIDDKKKFKYGSPAKRSVLNEIP